MKLAIFLVVVCAACAFAGVRKTLSATESVKFIKFYF